MRAAAVAVAGALAAACGPDTLVQVRERIEVAPEALDFQSLPVLHEKKLDVVISNRGRAPLEVSSVALKEPSAVFIVGDFPREVGGGATLPVTVTFKPEAEADYAAVLVIESSDRDRRTVEVPLVGHGSTISAICLDPEELDFGRVGEGRTGIRRLRIQSCGTADLIVEELYLKDGTPAEYGFLGSVKTPSDPIRAPSGGNEGAKVEVTLKFSPVPATAETDGVLVVKSTDPLRRIVEVPLKAQVNRAPIADAGQDLQAPPNTTVELDGSASHDPDGDEPLLFRWELVERPQSSASELQGADQVKPTLHLDQPGRYVAQLVVIDAQGLQSRLDPDGSRVQVVAVPAEKLYVELVWNHPITDLDLHFIAPEGLFGTDTDCYAGNPGCDFGVLGDPRDNPTWLRDDLSGFGPEAVSYERPVDGVYTVAVHFYADHLAPDPRTSATVRIYEFGVPIFEASKELALADERWDACTIEWPSGIVEAAAE